MRGDSQERESVLAIYSHLYTYSVDTEKNNEILKSALNASKRLVRMLVNMQDGMREYFDELPGRKILKGSRMSLSKRSITVTAGSTRSLRRRTVSTAIRRRSRS